MKTTVKDILKENTQLKQMPFSTPEGYFESLKQNLKDKGHDSRGIGTVAIWSRISVAAAIAILVTAGAILMSSPSTANEFTEEDYLVFSDDISTDVIYSASTLYAYTEEISDEDIIEYLIDSDWETDDIE